MDFKDIIKNYFEAEKSAVKRFVSKIISSDKSTCDFELCVDDGARTYSKTMRAEMFTNGNWDMFPIN